MACSTWGRLAPVVAAGWLWLAAGSAAGAPLRYSAATNDCQTLSPCVSDADCGDAPCVAVPGDEDTHYCSATVASAGTAADVYCCDPATEGSCGDTGTCLVVSGTLGVCKLEASDPRALCDEAGSAASIGNCYWDPLAGAFTDDWALGDCDEDRKPNQLELDLGCEVCVVDPGCPPDGGLPPPPDAGSNTPDAAVTMDGGVPKQDGGSARSGITYDYRGSGGCQAGGAGTGGIWLLVGLAVLLGRALRRRAG